MTNKPMLSVERLLTEIRQSCELSKSRDAQIDAALVELRALLDKPVDERKPFAWYRVPKDFPLQGAFFPYIEGQSERDIQNSLDAEFGFYVKRLYDEPAAQHQGEPVALQHMAVSEGGVLRWMTGRKMQDCELYAMPDGLAIRSKLYAEQPAPVAVVMPELKTPYYKVVPTKFGNKEGFWQITPDSSIVYDNRDEAQARADARNASRAQHFFDSLKPCLEEVARLNGVKP